jgi:hypothetical protein
VPEVIADVSMNDSKFSSRKFLLACAVFLVATVTLGGLLIDGDMKDPMPLLYWYLSMSSSVLVLYGGANVIEKNGRKK